MESVIGVGLLFGIPFAVFIWANWKQEQRDRERDQRADGPERRRGSHDSHWGGMGRPGGRGR